MKTKFIWVALLASAALIAQAKAGGHNGGGGGRSAGPSGPAHVSSPSFGSGPRGNFGGGRFFAPGLRFSSNGRPMTFRQQRFSGSDLAFAGRRQVATGSVNHRSDRAGMIGNRGSGAGRDRIVARHDANWHRDWDRRSDHWWHGHRCHFINGSWFVFDIDPFDYWYPYYGYPSDYYGYDYYPSGDYSEYYDPNYYGEQPGNSVEQGVDDTVAGAQAQLRKQGYYHGDIDGVFGVQTRRAITRYQSDHSLRVTGTLTTDTLHALGM